MTPHPLSPSGAAVVRHPPFRPLRCFPLIRLGGPQITAGQAGELLGGHCAASIATLRA